MKYDPTSGARFPADSMQHAWRQLITAALVLLCLVGVFMRFYRLDAHELWFDEVCSIFMIHNDLADVNSPAVQDGNKYFDSNPPLYYESLKVWAKVCGVFPLSLRLFSVFWSVLSLPLFYQLARRFCGSKAALCAVAMMALSPFHLWYAQEARMYSQAACFGIASTLFFMLALEKKRWQWWAGYFCASAVLMEVSYYSVFLLVSHGAALIYLRRKQESKEWLLCVASLALLFARTLLVIVQAQLEMLRSAFWLTYEWRFDAVVLFKTLQVFMLGYTGTALGYAVVTVAPIFLATSWLKTKPRREQLLPIIFLGVPLAVVFGYSACRQPIMLPRQLILFSPFLYIVIAQASAGLVGLRRRVVIGTLFVLLLLGVINYFRDIVSPWHMRPGVHVKRPISPLVNLWLQERKRADAYGVSNYGLRATFRYYLHQTDPQAHDSVPCYYFYIPGKDFEFELHLPFSQSIRRYIPVNVLGQPLRAYGMKRCWLFTTSWDRDGTMSYNDRLVYQWFKNKYRSLKEIYYEGVWMTLFDVSQEKVRSPVVSTERTVIGT